MSDIDFTGCSDAQLVDLLAEQTHVREVTGAKQRIATEVNREMELESEVLSGFEMVEAIKTEITRRTQ